VAVVCVAVSDAFELVVVAGAFGVGTTTITVAGEAVDCVTSGEIVTVTG
jgi:hypothetical protein